MKARKHLSLVLITNHVKVIISFCISTMELLRTIVIPYETYINLVTNFVANKHQNVTENVRSQKQGHDEFPVQKPMLNQTSEVLQI